MNSFSFSSSFKWNSSLCLLSFYQTHLYPPQECLQYLNSSEINNLDNQLYNKQILITGTARSGTTMIATLASSLGVPLSNDAHPATEIGTASWSLASPPHIDPMCPHQSSSSLSSLSSIQTTRTTIENDNEEPDTWMNIRKKYRFKYIFHQVRNPLASIPSLITEISHLKRCKNEMLQILPNLNLSPSTPEQIALQVWVEWNFRLDRFPFIPTYRVEDFNLFDLLRSINYTTITMTEDDFICAYYKFFGYNSRVSFPSSFPSSLPNPFIAAKQKFTWKHLYQINQSLTIQAMDMAYNYGYRYYKNSSLVQLRPSYSQKYLQQLVIHDIELENNQNASEQQQQLPKEQQQNSKRNLFTQHTPSTPSARVKVIKRPQFQSQHKNYPLQQYQQIQNSKKLVLNQQQHHHQYQHKLQQQQQQLLQKLHLQLQQQQQQIDNSKQSKKYYFMERYSATCNLIMRGLVARSIEPKTINKLSNVTSQLNLIETKYSGIRHKLFEHPIFVD